MKLTELKDKKLTELKEIAKQMNIEKSSSMSKDDLINAISSSSSKNDDNQKSSSDNNNKTEKMAAGVLEILPDGYGFLRSVNDNYLPGPEDIYVSPSQIKRFKLKTGHFVEGSTRAPKSKERFHALLQLSQVNGVHPEKIKDQRKFDKFTPLHPNEKFNLSNTSDMSMRIMDMVHQ